MMQRKGKRQSHNLASLAETSMSNHIRSGRGETRQRNPRSVFHSHGSVPTHRQDDNQSWARPRCFAYRAPMASSLYTDSRDLKDSREGGAALQDITVPVVAQHRIDAR